MKTLITMVTFAFVIGAGTVYAQNNTTPSPRTVAPHPVTNNIESSTRTQPKAKPRDRYGIDRTGYEYEYDRDTFNETGAGIQYLDPQNMGKGVPSTATQTIDMR